MTRRMVLCAALFAACLSVHAESEGQSARFHHVHLNVADPAATIAWYSDIFGAVPIKFNGAADALLTGRSFILLNKVAQPAPWKMESGIYHIGWGGVDGPSDFKWRDEQGVQWETPINTLGTNYYMYAFGPDKEVAEIWTGYKHHRFGHVHLFARDVNATKHWYMNHLGLNGPEQDTPKPPKAPDDLEITAENAFAMFRYLWMAAITTDDDITINIFAAPSKDSIVWWNYEEGIETFQPTDGRVIDHIAFSYPSIDAAFERMKAAGVEIVKPIATDPELNLKSFFVRGPDKVLIEIVEAGPIPESSWE